MRLDWTTAKGARQGLRRGFGVIHDNQHRWGAYDLQADKPAAAPKTTATTKPPRIEKSLECSKQADGKGFHGKPCKARAMAF